MKNSLTVSMLLFLAISVYAQHKDAGTTEFPYLNNNYDSRSIAMAGASVAIPNGLYGTFTNPAALAMDIEQMEIFLGYTYIVEGVWGVPVAFARSFGNYGVFAVNLFSANTGVEAVDIDNKKTGEFARANFLAGGVSWGFKYKENLLIGASLKGIYNRLVDYSSDGVCIDVGVQYRLKNNRLVYGLAAKNIGFMIDSYTHDGERSLLPMTIEGGVSFVPRSASQLRIALDINKKIGDYVNFEPALEFNVYKKVLLVRAGYAFSQKDAAYVWNLLQGDKDENYIKSNMSSLCVGTGLKTNINTKDVRVDFGIQFHTFMLTPALSLSALIAL
jgi:hypothetical protein